MITSKELFSKDFVKKLKENKAINQIPYNNTIKCCANCMNKNSNRYTICCDKLNTIWCEYVAKDSGK